jgi:hypothetical protein
MIFVVRSMINGKLFTHWRRLTMLPGGRSLPAPRQDGATGMHRAAAAAGGTNHRLRRGHGVAPHSRRRVAGYNTRLPPRFFAHIRAKLLRAHLRSGLNLVPCAE